MPNQNPIEIETSLTPRHNEYWTGNPANGTIPAMDNAAPIIATLANGRLLAFPWMSLKIKEFVVPFRVVNASDQTPSPNALGMISRKTNPTLVAEFGKLIARIDNPVAMMEAYPIMRAL